MNIHNDSTSGLRDTCRTECNWQQLNFLGFQVHSLVISSPACKPWYSISEGWPGNRNTGWEQEIRPRTGKSSKTSHGQMWLRGEKRISEYFSLCGQREEDWCLRWYDTTWESKQPTSKVLRSLFEAIQSYYRWLQKIKLNHSNTLNSAIWSPQGKIASWLFLRVPACVSPLPPLETVVKPGNWSQMPHCRTEGSVLLWVQSQSHHRASRTQITHLLQHTNVSSDATAPRHQIKSFRPPEPLGKAHNQIFASGFEIRVQIPRGPCPDPESHPTLPGEPH